VLPNLRRKKDGKLRELVASITELERQGLVYRIKSPASMDHLERRRPVKEKLVEANEARVTRPGLVGCLSRLDNKRTLGLPFKT
jgi:hypothetical protein